MSRLSYLIQKYKKLKADGAGRGEMEKDIGQKQC